MVNRKISELIRLYHTKTRIICKDQSTSAVSLSLDEIMEAFKGLMKCEKEELIRYLLNDGMF